ncbi:unnamed protein product [Hapterophycus canaliculatus]
MPQASFKSVEAELTLEELPCTSAIAMSHDRMLEEIGLKNASPRSPSAGGDKNHNTTLNNNDADSDCYTGPTWTRTGLGGYPMKLTTTRGGERQSALAAFVKPVKTMPNLKVKDDATVTRVIIEGERAVGVEIVESSPRRWGGRGTRVRQVRLTKERAEIFVCCGAFRSPKLLMLSGVGPKEHLKDKGVSVLVDLPHIDENLQDHRIAASSKTAPKMPSSSPPTTVVVGLLCSDGGSVSQTLAYCICMLLTQPGLLGTARRAAVHALCWLTPIRRALRNSRIRTVVFTMIKNKGTVRLASGTDPSTPPLIDPGYLSHPQDRQAACEVWRLARRAKETPTGKAICGIELTLGKKYNFGEDDESFLGFVRDNRLSYFHLVGTCRRRKGVEDSVVSSDNLRVHGVSGLRVADASVAPHIPATPTQTMCMMIGDRAAAIALGDRFGEDQVQVR